MTTLTTIAYLVLWGPHRGLTTHRAEADTEAGALALAAVPPAEGLTHYFIHHGPNVIHKGLVADITPAADIKRRVEIGMWVLPLDHALADIDSDHDYHSFVDREDYACDVATQADIDREVIEAVEAYARLTELTRWGVGFEVIDRDCEIDDLDAALLMDGVVRRKGGTNYIDNKRVFPNMDIIG